MPKTVLDLRLYQVEEIDEDIIDRKGVHWRIYGGTPATLFTRLLALQEQWPKDDDGNMVDNPDPEQMPADIGTQTLQAIWDNLSRANAGRSYEEMLDGILVEDALPLLNFLSLRSRLRLEEQKAALAAQREPEQAPTPTTRKSPSTSKRKRPASATA